jgi:hypothetical protein
VRVIKCNKAACSGTIATEGDGAHFRIKSDSFDGFKNECLIACPRPRVPPLIPNCAVFPNTTAIPIGQMPENDLYLPSGKGFCKAKLHIPPFRVDRKKPLALAVTPPETGTRRAALSIFATVHHENAAKSASLKR